MPIDAERLLALSEALSNVVAEPGLWPEFLEKFAEACGASAALLLPSTGSDGVTASPRNGEAMLRTYIDEGWHEGDRDPRKRAIPIASRGEVAIDADVISIAEMSRSPFYNDALARHDSKWWAGIGFPGGSSEIWCLSVLRSERQGEFEQTDKRILQELTGRLSEIVKLSSLMGRTALSEVTNSFDRIQQAAIAIDDRGHVLRANASANTLFGDAISVSKGQLFFRDSEGAKAYQELLNRIRWTIPGKPLRASPIVVRRASADPLLIEVLPIDGAARSPFLHARALLLLKPVSKPAQPDWHLLVDIFGLTPAEARLSATLATGVALERAADELCIAKETARHHLKSVFRKTDVNRQAELVALLSSLPRST